MKWIGSNGTTLFVIQDNLSDKKGFVSYASVLKLEPLCQLCPEGHKWNQTNLTYQCEKCPPGYESNVERTQCVQCSIGTFNWKEGDGCKVYWPIIDRFHNQ